MTKKQKRQVGKHLGVVNYRPLGGMYVTWQYSYTDFDDGTQSEDFYVAGDLFRPALPWEKEDVSVLDADGTKKLMRVRE